MGNEKGEVTMDTEEIQSILRNYYKQPMDHWRNQRGNQKIPRRKWKWKHNNPKPMGSSKSSFKRELYSGTSLPQKIRKISNNLALHPKQLEKEQTKHKVSRRKEIIKIRAEINEIETKKKKRSMKLN